MLQEIFKGMDNAAEKIDENFGLLGASNETQLMTVNRDLTQTGNQKITGFSRKPKYMDVFGVVVGTGPTISFGHVDSNGEQASVGINKLVNTTASGDAAIVFADTTQNYANGKIIINEDNSIDINWIKGGSGATGNAIIRLIAHY